MEEYEPVSSLDIEEWIKLEEDEFQIKDFRYKHSISPEDSLLYVVFNRLCDKRFIKRVGRGWYRKVKPVSPLKIKDSDSDAYFDLMFPRSHTDFSTFGFEDFIQISEGDQIIIAGRSNAGKTCLAHNIIGENNVKHKCVLMGNEYSSNEGFLLPKYLRRFKRMEWANLINDSKLNFECLPVKNNYEDYVQKDKINVIDWIQLEKDWFRMGKILDDIKTAAGRGITVVVLQKKEGVDYGQGGEPTEHVADVYMTVDPMGKWEARLTLGKVKETKQRVQTRGRVWGFETTDGSNIFNIREMTACPSCRGKGVRYDRASGIYADCERCIKKGYIDLE